MQKEINDKKGIQGFARWTKTDNDGNIIDTSGWMKNLIPNGNVDTGVGLLFEHLLGNPVNPLEITQGRIGTGNTPTANSDVGLDVDVVGTNPALKVKELNSRILLSFFFPNALLPDDTYKEFGLFAVSQLFSRLLFFPELIKGPGENVTIDYRIEILNI
ncbi:MAG: hypothetical protein KAS32_00085 [Candidatus Peribacteraceae bacterium]|nr:hypothetical protein [Candidatus Peribacteraceae bacterium]